MARGPNKAPSSFWPGRHVSAVASSTAGPLAIRPASVVWSSAYLRPLSAPRITRWTWLPSISFVFEERKCEGFDGVPNGRIVPEPSRKPMVQVLHEVLGLRV
jgi:hypothetical protein